MALVACGFTSCDIGVALFLSPHTVRTHVRNAMASLGASTRAHAVAIALVDGQIEWASDIEGRGLTTAG